MAIVRRLFLSYLCVVSILCVGFFIYEAIELNRDAFDRCRFCLALSREEKDYIRDQLSKNDQFTTRKEGRTTRLKIGPEKWVVVADDDSLGELMFLKASYNLRTEPKIYSLKSLHAHFEGTTYLLITFVCSIAGWYWITWIISGKPKPMRQARP
jgi:hypothetical protein